MFSSAYMSFGKGITTLLLALLALSPCTLKKTVLKAFDTEFAGSLNKSKTTAPQLNTCNTSITASAKVWFVKSDPRSVDSGIPTDFNAAAFRDVKKSTLSTFYSPVETGSSPPRYILFKRLKLALV